MSISHDAETRFPATDGTNGVSTALSLSTATGDQTFSHAGAAGACGAVVVVASTGTTAVVTGVLYGGVAMTLTETATDTSETGRVDIYTLVNGVPGGTQTVTLQGATATGKWATCSTVTSTNNSVRLAGNNHANTTTSTNPTVTVTTDSTALLYGAVAGGAADPASYAAGTGYTAQFNEDYGAQSARTQRRTSSVAAGSITFNFTFATSDDWCIAAIALAEGAKIAATVAGVGTLTTSGLFPGLTQWAVTASKSTAAAQTGPSWSISPDGANAVGLVFTGAISSVAAPTGVALTGTTAGVGAVTGALSATSKLTGAPAGTGAASGALAARSLLRAELGGPTTDTFSYPNGTLGAPWVAWTRVAGAASLTVSSGTVAPTTGILGDASYPLSIGPDCFMESYLTGTMQADMSYGVAVRLTAHSAAADGYMAELNDVGGGGARLVLYRDSGFTSIADTGTVFTSSMIDALRIRVIGTTVKGDLRISGVWTEVASVTDATFAAAGYPGFWVQDGAAVGGSVDRVAFGPIGVLAGTGLVAGALSSPFPFSGTTAGIGASSGSLSAGVPAVAGTAAGSGAATGTVRTSAPLSGGADGGGALPSALTVTAALTGAAAGIGAATGAARASSLLTGTAGGAGTATASLVTTPPGLTQWALSATRGTGTQLGPSWAITPDGPDGSALVWVGAIAGMAAYLAGAAAGTGAAAGVLATPTFLAGSASGSGSTTGTPAGSPVLAGSAAGIGSLPSALTTVSRLAATAAGTGQAAGTVSTLGAGLTGSASGVGSMSGIPSAGPRIAGTAAGVGAAIGQPWVVPGLTHWTLTASKATISTQTGPSWSASPDGPAAVALVWSGALRPFTLSPDLAGVIAGAGSATGVLTVPGLAALTGAAGGTGSAAATLSAPSPAWLTAFTRHAPGMLGFSLTFDRAVAAGVGTVIGGLASSVPNLSGVAAGASTVTGALAAVSQLAGSAAGTGSASGSMVVARLLSGTVAGTGSATGVLAGQLAGTASGAGSASGTLRVASSLSGVVAGVGSASPSQVTTPGQPVLGGAANGAGAISATLKVSGALSGVVAGAGLVAGALTAPAVLQGSANGVGALPGNLTATFAVAGSAVGVGAVSGVMTVFVQFGGSVDGTGPVAGLFTATSVMAGAPAGSGSALGNLTVPGLAAFTGVLVGGGSVAGALQVPAPGALAGVSSGNGSAIATLGSLLALSGALAGAGAVNGTVSVPAMFAATVYGYGHATGHLRSSRRKPRIPPGVNTRVVAGTGTITP